MDLQQALAGGEFGGRELPGPGAGKCGKQPGNAVLQLRGAAATQITPGSFERGSAGVNSKGCNWQWSLWTLQFDQGDARVRYGHDLPHESNSHVTIYLFMDIYTYIYVP